MIDGDSETYWSPESTKATAVELNLSEPVTFNALTLTEHESYITDYKIEAKLSGSNTYTELYAQDEMGNRTAILDNTYTAQDFRITAQTSQANGGISEISFDLKGSTGNTDFRNIGYCPAINMNLVRANNYGELQDLTDIIMFGYGVWNKDGSFTWDATYNEQFLADTMTEIRNALGRDVNFWFCFNKYNNDTITSEAELFATETARQTFTDYAIYLCETYGFVGIDIDYEYPHKNTTTAGEKQTAWTNYYALLNYAGDRLHYEGYKLSCAMLDNNVLYTQSSGDAFRKIDYVNIMAYDREHSDSRNRHSTYEAAQTAIEYFVSIGFEKSQLVLGVPYYLKPVEAEVTTQKYNFIIDYAVSEVTKRTNYVIANKLGNEILYYFNGYDMIRDKTYLAMTEGCNGVFNWSVGCDISRENPLALSGAVAEAIERFK